MTSNTFTTVETQDESKLKALRAKWTATYAALGKTRDELERLRTENPHFVSASDWENADAAEAKASAVNSAAQDTYYRAVVAELEGAISIAAALGKALEVPAEAGHKLSGTEPSSLPALAVLPVRSKEKAKHSDQHGWDGPSRYDVRWLAGRWSTSPTSEQIEDALKGAPGVFKATCDGADGTYRLQASTYKAQPALAADSATYSGVLESVGTIQHQLQQQVNRRLGMQEVDWTERHGAVYDSNARVTSLSVPKAPGVIVSESTSRAGVVTRKVKVTASLSIVNRIGSTEGTAWMRTAVEGQLGRLLPGVGVVAKVSDVDVSSGPGHEVIDGRLTSCPRITATATFEVVSTRA